MTPIVNGLVFSTIAVLALILLVVIIVLIYDSVSDSDSGE